MSLAKALSIDGLLPTMIQHQILKLRLVSREIMMVLESNTCLQINLRINDSGVKGLTAGFLKRWHGRVNLQCSCPWNPDSRWFKEVRDALLLGQLRPLNLLNLSVRGHDLIALGEMLSSLSEKGPAILQLKITYRGNGEELLAAAAPLASLGQTLTMRISVLGTDPAGSTMSLWLQRLLTSSININSISLRSSPPLQCPSCLHTPCHSFLARTPIQPAAIPSSLRPAFPRVLTRESPRV